ncbi:MAG: hypothetical protein QOI46_4557 [Alphaproteobacteria bacterium]|jgi:hypothetical protein|nr:hypothetical protein [Alphaproteobacteria bacterium]
MILKFLATGIFAERRSRAAAVLSLFILLALGAGSLAAEIRQGATMQVKSDSIWFDDAAKLTRWQELKKGGDAAAFKSYQEDALSERDAWQFTGPLTVKILSYKRTNNQVNVEMKTKGRMLGTKWFLDPEALMQ